MSSQPTWSDLVGAIFLLEYVSQPSASHQLKLLQEEYGITLFKKNGRGLELTEIGRAFLRDVEPITAQIEGLKSEVSWRTDSPGQRLIKRRWKSWPIAFGTSLRDDTVQERASGSRFEPQDRYERRN